MSTQSIKSNVGIAVKNFSAVFKNKTWNISVSLNIIVVSFKVNWIFVTFLLSADIWSINLSWVSHCKTCCEFICCVGAINQASTTEERTCNVTRIRSYKTRQIDICDDVCIWLTICYVSCVFTKKCANIRAICCHTVFNWKCWCLRFCFNTTVGNNAFIHPCQKPSIEGFNIHFESCICKLNFYVFQNCVFWNWCKQTNICQAWKIISSFKLDFLSISIQTCNFWCDWHKLIFCCLNVVWQSYVIQQNIPLVIFHVHQIIITFNWNWTVLSALFMHIKWKFCVNFVGFLSLNLCEFILAFSHIEKTTHWKMIYIWLRTINFHWSDSERRNLIISQSRFKILAFFKFCFNWIFVDLPWNVLRHLIHKPVHWAHNVNNCVVIFQEILNWKS